MTQETYKEGKYEVYEWTDGTKHWYLNNQRHRDNDLPAVEYANGSKEWWLNNQLHRDNDMPAVVIVNGRGKTKAWWLNGIRQPDKIAKCYFIKDNQKQFKWFSDIDTAQTTSCQASSLVNNVKV